MDIKKDRNNDYKNQRWTIDEITKAFKYENPCMSQKDCENKAREVFRGMKSLNNSMRYNNNKYYSKFVPMSLFETENGEHLFYEASRLEC